MRKRLIAFLLVMMLGTVSLAGFAGADPVTKYVYTRNSKPLNVRVWPDITSALLGLLPNGSQVTVNGYSNDYTWATIQYNGQTAYVMTQYLADVPGGYTPVPTPQTNTTDTKYQNLVNALESEFRTYRVVSPYMVLAKPTRATGWVNLRYAPTAELGHAENLYANTQLTVIAETRNWLQVRRNDSGTTGYVMRKYTISMGVGASN